MHSSILGEKKEEKDKKETDEKEVGGEAGKRHVCRTVTSVTSA